MLRISSFSLFCYFVITSNTCNIFLYRVENISLIICLRRGNFLNSIQTVVISTSYFVCIALCLFTGIEVCIDEICLPAGVPVDYGTSEDTNIRFNGSLAIHSSSFRLKACSVRTDV